MTKIQRILFLALTAIAVAATIGPFSLYTMSTIHVLSVERWFVGLVCLGVAAFTVLVWRRERLALAPAVASDLLFGLWYFYSLIGTIQSHNYLSWKCLIIPFAWAASLFVGAGALIFWGAAFCRRQSTTMRSSAATCPADRAS
jgi:hypothetical protein